MFDGAPEEGSVLGLCEIAPPVDDSEAWVNPGTVEATEALIPAVAVEAALDTALDSTVLDASGPELEDAEGLNPGVAVETALDTVLDSTVLDASGPELEAGNGTEEAAVVPTEAAAVSLETGT